MTDYDKALLKYLTQFLSDNRIELFEKILDKRTRHFAIALEDIFQPHNANAVIRSAECFGIQDIYTIETINDFVPSKGVSKGSIKWVNQTSFDAFEPAYQAIKDKGYQIVATTPHADGCELADFDFTKKSAFFFGAEKEGISDKTKEIADVFLKIPMQGFTESLNISVSAAIIMQQVTAQLRQSEAIEWQLKQEEREVLLLEWTKKSVQRIDTIINEFNKNWNK